MTRKRISEARTDAVVLQDAAEVLRSWGYGPTAATIDHIRNDITAATEAARSQIQKGA